MPDLNKWIELYRSDKHQIKIRAAQSLLQRSDAPLWALLDILDNLSHEGLGAPAERVLLGRRDFELFGEMIVRLNSNDNFIREVACNILGQFGNHAATQHLLKMINDPHIMVRRAACLALAHLKDRSAIPELERQLLARQNDDTNVVWALKSAIRSLRDDTKKNQIRQGENLGSRD